MLRELKLSEKASIYINDDINVEKYDPEIDFFLYRIMFRGKLLMVIYVGNHPQFPVNDCIGDVEEIVVGNNRMQTQFCQNQDEPIGRNYLLDTKDMSGPERFLHIFVHEADNVNEKTQIDSVLKSIEVK